MAFDKIEQSAQKKVESSFASFIVDYLGYNTFPGVLSYMTHYCRDNFLVSMVSRYYSSQYFGDFWLFFSSPELWCTDEIRYCIDGHFSSILAMVEIYTTQVSEDVVDICILWDVHPAGHCKCRVDTRNDSFIVYINSHNSDLIWRDMFVTLDEKRENVFPSILFLGTIHKRKYIVVEDNTDSIWDIRSYYMYLWKLTHLIWFVRWVDINFENILCHIPYPIIFDYECLLTPNLDPYWDHYDVRFTGFISDDAEDNYSVLLWWYQTLTSYTVPILSFIDGLPKITWTVPSRWKYFHIPQFHHKPQTVLPYREHFLSGRDSFWSYVGPLRKLLNDFVCNNNPYNRILLRPTRIYDILLKEISLQRALGNTDVYSQIKTKLLSFRILPNMLLEPNFIDYEIRTLLEWFIPSYYVRSLDNTVVTPEDVVVWLLYETPYQTWQRDDMIYDSRVVTDMEHWDVLDPTILPIHGQELYEGIVRGDPDSLLDGWE